MLIYDDIYLVVVVPNIGFEMPDRITLGQAASISVSILPFVVPTYTPEPHGLASPPRLKPTVGLVNTLAT